MSRKWRFETALLEDEKQMETYTDFFGDLKGKIGQKLALTLGTFEDNSSQWLDFLSIVIIPILIIRVVRSNFLSLGAIATNHLIKAPC